MTHCLLCRYRVIGRDSTGPAVGCLVANIRGVSESVGTCLPCGSPASRVTTFETPVFAGKILNFLTSRPHSFFGFRFECRWEQAWGRI